MKYKYYIQILNTVIKNISEELANIKINPRSPIHIIDASLNLWSEHLEYIKKQLTIEDLQDDEEECSGILP